MPQPEPSPTPATGPAAGPPPERVAAAAGRQSLATLVSRLTGLLRETVAAALFGLSATSDALVFAFRIPNLLREFFAEGALSSAFVPVLARARREEGEARANLLARRVLGTLTVVTGAVTLLGIAFAPEVVAFVAPEADAALQPLTVSLTRVMFPFLMLASLAAAAMGVLNTQRRYVVPALAPAAFNVVAVAGGVVLLAAGVPEVPALHVWAWLVVAGGLAQVLVQVPSLRAVGYRGLPQPDLAFRDPLLRTIARRMGPVVIGLAGTNVMVLITTMLASREAGWASALSYAFRLVHLPIGLVGVAIGTVLLAAGARRAAEGDAAGLDDLVRRGLRLSWFLALPAALGLLVLAEPLVRLVFQHGRFTAAAVADTAEALRWYAVCVVGYAGVKAGAPVFLARGDTRTPMVCSLAGIALNLAVALLLVGPLGFRALALAVGAGTGLNFLLLRQIALRRYGPGSAPGLPFLVRVGLAGAAMGLAGWALVDLWPGGHGPGRLATVLLVPVLAAVYFLAAALLALPEAAWVRARVLRR